MTEKKKKRQTDEEARMTFTEHLTELRIRIIRSAIALVICVVVAYIFSDEIFQLVSAPLRPLASGVVETPVEGQPETSGPAAPEWTAFNILEPILVKLKLSVIAGILVALPVIVYQACAFVFPGLKPNEKKAVRILLSGGAALALAGVCVAYFGVLRFVLPYLMQFAPENVRIDLRMNENVAIILKALLGFAVAFQFPMAVMILVYLDLLSPETLKRYRRVAIVGLAVAAAMLTPPDPGTMIIMLVPLVALYEGSIWMSYLVVRKRKKNQAEGAES